MLSDIDGHPRARTFGVLGMEYMTTSVCHVLGQFIPVSSLSFTSSFLFGTTEPSLICLASSLFVALITVAVLCHL